MHLLEEFTQKTPDAADQDLEMPCVLTVRL